MRPSASLLPATQTAGERASATRAAVLSSRDPESRVLISKVGSLSSTARLISGDGRITRAPSVAWSR
jgi:hypothetical protein